MQYNVNAYKQDISGMDDREEEKLSCDTTAGMRRKETWVMRSQTMGVMYHFSHIAKKG